MDTNNKYVSIIIPVYNRQSVIEECIDSVLAQSYKSFEIIIIDDGSTDNTVEICRQAAAKDNRIKILFGAHGGVSSARNKGLDAAKGDYIFFLDSDDIIHPMLLEMLVCGLEENNASITGTKSLNCPQQYWFKTRNKFLNDATAAEITYHEHNDALRCFFYAQSPFNVMSGTMMRRDLIGDTRYKTDLFIGEDFYFIYENLAKGANATFLKQQWCLNRIHDNNISFQYDFDAFWSRFHRRELVWKNEELLERSEYANLQKSDAFGCFIRCFQRQKPHSADVKRMRKTLKEYKKTVYPVLSRRDKGLYLLALYCPGMLSLYFKTINLLKKLKKGVKGK